MRLYDVGPPLTEWTCDSCRKEITEPNDRVVFSGKIYVPGIGTAVRLDHDFHVDCTPPDFHDTIQAAMAEGAR